MKQYTENQYDDDLTVGTDGYDDSYHTDVDDLFEFSTDEESPISRLKSLILSIDWEITDDVLMQFNEELVDLRGIWAGEKINLVYVQALEKISKYIYHKKAASHPSAIKLLLTLYHNLEKIVSSEDLSDQEKKEILLKDVKKFENLKREIGKQAEEVEEPEAVEEPIISVVPEKAVENNELLALKAIVLGIDWEITDKDLNELRREVGHLEGKFVNDKPKLILLQGIGTIGAYIKLKKSDSHPDAFKVLHLFYESLEKLTLTPMDPEEEKAILLPAVEIFNSFKIQLGKTISDDGLSRNEEKTDVDQASTDPDAITPAFADIPEEEVRGFQAEEEAQGLGLDSSGNIGSEVETFFTDEGFLSTESSANVSDDNGEAVAVEEMIGAADMFAAEEDHAVVSIAKEVALLGVDVEEGDGEELGEDLTVEEDGLAPALSFENEEPEESGATLPEDKIELKDDSDSPPEESKESALSSDFSDDDESEERGRNFSKLDREVALQGVDVETEADEEDDEEALPMTGEEVAPALVENDEVSIYNAEILEQSIAKEELSEEIVVNLDDFFDEKQKTSLSALPEETEGNSDDTTLQVEPEKKEIKLDGVGDSQTLLAVPKEDAEEVEESEDPGEVDLVAMDDGDAIVLELEEQGKTADDGAEAELIDEIAEEINLIAEPEVEVKDQQTMLSPEREFEQSRSENAEPGILEEGDAEDKVPAELDQQLDSFFDLGETVEQPEDESLLLVVPEESGSEEADDGAEVELIDEIAEEIDLIAEPEVEVKEQQSMLSPESEFEQSRSENAEPDILEEGDAEDKVPAELDQQLDSFFDLGETVEQPEDESLLLVVPEESGSEDIPVTEKVVFAPALSDMTDEEEVVFELAEEDELFSPAANVVDEREYSDELSGNADTDRQIDKNGDTFGVLRTHVESLGGDVDGKVVEGIYQEINVLRQTLSEKPVEKTFLQLLSTVTQHIDQKRDGSSDSAYELLESVCNALNDLQDDTQQHNQELLLEEVSKVLEWQQGLLVRQSAK